MTLRPVFLAGLLLAAGACKGKSPEEPSVSTPSRPVWSAFKGKREVLRFKEEPGPITSRALPAPGASPGKHPFLTATSLDIDEEDALQTILQQAKGFQDFAERLKKAGYTVKPSDMPL